jgi:phosphoenolpyruvate carboxykinase (ATP)
MKRNFSALNFILPEQRHLPMHCSANVGDKDDTHFLWFVWNRKTTLSADPKEN